MIQVPDLAILTDGMPVLSVRLPWALLILQGKDIENRGWSSRVRGRIAIHTSKSMTLDEYKDAAWFCESIGEKCPSMESLKPLFGHVIGTVEMEDCVKLSSSPWFQGRFGFVLRDPLALEVPVPAVGKLGFWPWSEARRKAA